MLTRKRAYSGAVIKKLHCGEIFEAVKLFPPGELPTKRHVIERMLDLPDFRTLSAAREVAKELHERWIWCNVYPQHHYTIATKIQQMMTTFSNVTQYPRKNLEPYKKMESSFLQDMDQLFDVYCVDEQQRRQMEIQHCLRMAREDFTFYEDQRTERKCRCVDEVVPLTQGFPTRGARTPWWCEAAFQRVRDGFSIFCLVFSIESFSISRLHSVLVQ